MEQYPSLTTWVVGRRFHARVPCNAGMRVALVRERSNVADGNAIQVVTILDDRSANGGSQSSRGDDVIVERRKARWWETAGRGGGRGKGKDSIGAKKTRGAERGSGRLNSRGKGTRGGRVSNPENQSPASRSIEGQAGTLGQPMTPGTMGKQVVMGEAIGHLSRAVAQVLAPVMDEHADVRFEGVITSTPSSPLARIRVEITPLLLTPSPDTPSLPPTSEPADPCKPSTSRTPFLSTWQFVIDATSAVQKRVRTHEAVLDKHGDVRRQAGGEDRGGVGEVEGDGGEGDMEGWGGEGEMRVRNFSLMLSTVLASDGHIFLPEERESLGAFQMLPPPAQYVFVRIFLRKGPWFLLSSLVKYLRDFPQKFPPDTPAAATTNYCSAQLSREPAGGREPSGEAFATGAEAAAAAAAAAVEEGTGGAAAAAIELAVKSLYAVEWCESGIQQDWPSPLTEEPEGALFTVTSSCKQREPCEPRAAATSPLPAAAAEEPTVDELVNHTNGFSHFSSSPDSLNGGAILSLEAAVAVTHRLLPLHHLRSLALSFNLQEKAVIRSSRKEALVRLLMQALTSNSSSNQSQHTTPCLRVPAFGVPASASLLLESLPPRPCFWSPCLCISSRITCLLARVQRLFFLNSSQSLTTFLLVDFGLRRYPSYRCHRSTPVFTSREELLAYEQACEVLETVERIVGVDSWEEGDGLGAEGAGTNRMGGRGGGGRRRGSGRGSGDGPRSGIGNGSGAGEKRKAVQDVGGGRMEGEVERGGGKKTRLSEETDGYCVVSNAARCDEEVREEQEEWRVTGEKKGNEEGLAEGDNRQTEGREQEDEDEEEDEEVDEEEEEVEKEEEDVDELMLMAALAGARQQLQPHSDRTSQGRDQQGGNGNVHGEGSSEDDIPDVFSCFNAKSEVLQSWRDRFKAQRVYAEVLWRGVRWLEKQKR
ncbi:unnamed protein product [Closterium sp. NIES-54]